ncbi:hypothetical protein F5883DRAFT_681933 [Diaporthe sp. PMI_573]|nr:hypothetical protein F5883DRAFT_681933 [Diaporthaceae sp. PMI_573]
MIRQTALSVIIDGGVEENPEDHLLAVHFLADGARHKIYEVTHPSWTTSYLFRVAIPLDPQLKMESEMATMEFVRRRTTIPVPKPVAWSSSASNPLGFEWCLLEKAPGLELREVWRTMPWEGKLRVVDQIAGIMAQLWDSAIKRRYIESNRGPFRSCSAWALPEVEWEFIKTARILLLSKSDLSDALKEEQWEYLVQEEIGLDEDDLPDFGAFEEAYHSYKELLPSLFGDQHYMASGERSFSLYNEDLRSANIIVNPSIYEITGVIDWEQATTMPDWYGIDYPAFLRGPNPFDEYDGPNTPVTYDSEDEKYNAATVSARDRRDGRLLRRRFDEAMGKLGRKEWNHKSALDELKSTFIEGVAALGDTWTGKRTLEQIRVSRSPWKGGNGRET